MGKPARLAALAATLVLLVTGLVGVGWLSGSTVLRQGRQDWGSMTPATAAGLAILAGDVLCGVLDAPARVRRAVSGATYFVALLGAVVLVEYATGGDFVVHRLFGRGDTTGSSPSPWIAIALLVAGLHVSPRRPRLGQMLLVLGGVPGYVALVGYGTGVAGLDDAGASVSMGWPRPAPFPWWRWPAWPRCPTGGCPVSISGRIPGRCCYGRCSRPR